MEDIQLSRTNITNSQWLYGVHISHDNRAIDQGCPGPGQALFINRTALQWRTLADCHFRGIVFGINAI